MRAIRISAPHTRITDDIKLSYLGVLLSSELKALLRLSVSNECIQLDYSYLKLMQKDLCFHILNNASIVVQVIIPYDLNACKVLLLQCYYIKFTKSTWNYLHKFKAPKYHSLTHKLRVLKNPRYRPALVVAGFT